MLKREEWLPLARKLDWEFSYTTEREVFPEVISGRPWLPHSAWKDWDESFKTSYREYVENQHEKDMAVYAVRDAVGRLENVQSLATPWINGLKSPCGGVTARRIHGHDRQSARRTLRARQCLESDGLLRRPGRIPSHTDSPAAHARTGALGRSLRLDA